MAGEHRAGRDRAARSGRHRARRARARRGHRRRRRPLRRLLCVVAVLVVLGAAGAAAVAYRLDGNLRSVDIDSVLGEDRPAPPDNGSMNVLVLGSDARSAKNKGSDEPARSDTAMVVHVYEGHRKAAIVSIPRDTLVTRPACTTPDGGRDPGGPRRMFNESFSVGGPACSVSTVERMSGLRMDHYVEVDFTGFQKIIDSLGGVRLTTTAAVKDQSSHLDLPAGTHTLDGEQALALVRTRKSIGDGSDLGRIQLQQSFVKALLTQVRGSGVLTSPTRLLALADTATKAMTTDSALGSTTALIRFASGLTALGSEGMQSLTLPVGPDAEDPNRVVPLTSAAQAVWEALRTDQPVPQSATEQSLGDKGSTGSLLQQ